MNDINNVTLNGRLTRDAELKHTNSGFAICMFSIASNYSEKKGDGYEDKPSFFACRMFGKYAETMHKYLLKGQQITIDGELRQDRWISDGNNKSKIIINVNKLQLMGSGKGQQNNKQASNDTFTDDIPF